MRVAVAGATGNIGTLMGLIDFLRGRRIEKWDPIKTDAQTI